MRISHIFVVGLSLGLTASGTCSFAQADGITLQCTLLKQNSFPQPGVIKVKYSNTSSMELAFQFRLKLVATNGATQMDSKGGLSKLLPNKSGTYSLPAFTDQQAVNRPPVYPQSCLIDQIEICPANPPTGHVGYYLPFHSPKCIGQADIGPVNFGSTASCTFALYGSVHGEVQDRWGVSIGAAWSHGQPTIEAAKADAYVKLQGMGIQRVINLPTATMDFEAHYTLSSDCTHQHGVVQAIRKVTPSGEVAPEGVWEGIGVGTADDKNTAAHIALEKCASLGSGAISQGQTCHIIDSW